MTEPKHPAYDESNPATSWALNPWHPMTKPIDLKHLGKLAEELGEAQSAVARCIIQGINEEEPITHKSNRMWLQEEIADVLANLDLVINHFKLDWGFISIRASRKKTHLSGWHSMLEDKA
jgi:NTP pyrophosphatase (non-canonical NTP hydrolase)